MSQSLDRRLGIFEKAGLRFHLLICHSCQIAYRQLDFMHQLCKRIAAGSEDITSLQPGLSAEAQERILKELRRKQGEQSASGD
jgi:hypothetical protein